MKRSKLFCYWVILTCQPIFLGAKLKVAICGGTIVASEVVSVIVAASHTV